MDYREIKNLIDKYWNGETSMQEEQKIRQYYAEQNNFEELKPYKSLFSFFEVERENTTSPEVEASILDSIGAKQRSLSTWKPLLRVAAAVLIMAVGGLTFYKASQNVTATNTALVYDDKPEDALKAYAEIKACLLYTSPSPRDRTRSRMPSSA